MFKYILDEKRVKKVTDLMEWAQWMERADRTVKKSKFGESEVSTVFLGIDHSFGGEEPLLFETMIFGNSKLSGYQERYSTWEEAEAGHEKACEFLKESKAAN